MNSAPASYGFDFSADKISEYKLRHDALNIDKHFVGIAQKRKDRLKESVSSPLALSNLAEPPSRRVSLSELKSKRGFNEEMYVITPEMLFKQEEFIPIPCEPIEVKSVPVVATESKKKKRRATLTENQKFDQAVTAEMVASIYGVPNNEKGKRKSSPNIEPLSEEDLQESTSFLDRIVNALKL